MFCTVQGGSIGSAAHHFPCLLSKANRYGFGKECTIPIWGLMQIGALQSQIHSKGMEAAKLRVGG